MRSECIMHVAAGMSNPTHLHRLYEAISDGDMVQVSLGLWLLFEKQVIATIEESRARNPFRRTPAPDRV
jgi:hypothetical protein